jgi:hypothetical protein
LSFIAARDRISAVSKAGNILGHLRTMHDSAVRLRDMYILYQSGSNPTFNAAFNAVFNTAEDRSAIGEMIDELTALCITDWETNHSDVITPT